MCMMVFVPGEFFKKIESAKQKKKRREERKIKRRVKNKE